LLLVAFLLVNARIAIFLLFASVVQGDVVNTSL